MIIYSYLLRRLAFLSAVLLYGSFSGEVSVREEVYEIDECFPLCQDKKIPTNHYRKITVLKQLQQEGAKPSLHES